MIQSTLVISTSLISNNRLSRSENQTTGNKILWKWGEIAPLFRNIFFNISLISGVKFHIHLWNMVVRFIFSSQIANLIYRGTDITKYSESLGLWDNESRMNLMFTLKAPSKILADHYYIFCSIENVLTLFVLCRRFTRNVKTFSMNKKINYIKVVCCSCDLRFEGQL